MIDEKDYEYDDSHNPDERYPGEWDADESDDGLRVWDDTLGVAWKDLYAGSYRFESDEFDDGQPDW